MFQQLSLFDNYSIDLEFTKNIKRHCYDLDEIDIGDITFTGGQQETIHRWYRLTPSFSPSLVRYFLRIFNANQNSLVFDPFCGRGTTVIECKKNLIPALGFEINPLLQKVGNYSLIWHREKVNLFTIFINTLKEQFSYFSSFSVDETVAILKTGLPNIHNVFRWWKPEIIKNLIIARELALSSEYADIYNFLWLAINSASLDCANIHRNHPTITFDDEHTRSIDVFSSITSHIEAIKNDLNRLSNHHLTTNLFAKIELRNSCKALNYNDQQITHIITSPPYPNRYSYVHQTRPQLYFMEVITKRSQATEIDLLTIGGTWGRATSNLKKELIIPENNILEILDYFPILREQNMLMCNYATKYFIDLNEHIKQLKKIIGGKFLGAYVVGNSRLSGVEIFTETILARLFELNGFKVKKIIVFRKRGGRKRLYETAVIVTV